MQIQRALFLKKKKFASTYKGFFFKKMHRNIKGFIIIIILNRIHRNSQSNDLHEGIIKEVRDEGSKMRGERYKVKMQIGS